MHRGHGRRPKRCGRLFVVSSWLPRLYSTVDADRPISYSHGLAVGFFAVLDGEDAEQLSGGAEEEAVVAEPKAEFAGVLTF